MVSQSVSVPRSVAFSAFRAGGLRAVAVRRSRHARSGVVLVASFAALPRAGRFAARWAGRVGRSVVVRRSGSLWAVSVPVSAPLVHVGGGLFAPIVGGLRGLLAVVGSWGLG